MKKEEHIVCVAVKPNAVTELIVLDQELTNIKVQWQPPINDRKLIFRVRYRSQWDPHGQWQVRTSPNRRLVLWNLESPVRNKTVHWYLCGDYLLVDWSLKLF